MSALKTDADTTLSMLAAILSRFDELDKKLDDLQRSLDYYADDLDRERMERDVRDIRAAVRSNGK
jgi:hypothetical protein